MSVLQSECFGDHSFKIIKRSTTTDFDSPYEAKDLFKLMNNAVFGKTMENVRNRIRYELVNDQKRFQTRQ